MKLLKLPLKLLDIIEYYGIIFILVSLAAILLTQIFYRYVLGRSVRGAEEMSRYLLVWLCFIGAPYVINKGGGHISIKLFAMLLPPKARNLLKLTTNFIVIISFLYILPTSYQYSIEMGRLGTPALGIPRTYVFISLPISLFLMIIRLLQVNIRILTNLEEENIASFYLKN